MKTIPLLVMVISLFSNNLYGNEKIAPYILDGSFVLYFPNIEKARSAWQLIFRKIYGIEYNNVISRIEQQIRDKMSVNILNPLEVRQIGIDPNKALSYVHLSENQGYVLFTVENEKVLRSILDRLDNPVHYRIIDNFVMFSENHEFLEYYDFKGLVSIDDFKRVCKITKFDWSQNFIWMDSNYFKEKTLLPYIQSVFPQGDRVSGTFDVNESNITLDLYTFYDDPAVNKALKNTMKTTPIQKLTMLDFVQGNSAIVGQMHLDVPSFFQMMLEIDQYDVLSFNLLYNDLKKNGLDLKEQIFPYLRGRFFYVVRELNLIQKKYDIVLASEISNTIVLQEILRELVRKTRARGMEIAYKSIFTKDFYGWITKDFTLWIGIAEGHLLVATDETTLVTLMHNMYQAKGGGLEQLPESFRKKLNKDNVSGQIFVQNPFFLEKIQQFQTVLPRSFMVSLKTMEWNFQIIDEGEKVGRRDIIFMNFFN